MNIIDKLKIGFCALFGGVAGLIKALLDWFNDRVLSRIKDKETAAKCLADIRDFRVFLGAVFARHTEWMSEARRVAADKILAADSHGASKELAESIADSLKKEKKTVFVLQCEDPRIRMNMLAHGNVDAALLPEPYATQVMRRGSRLLRNYSPTEKGVVAFRASCLKDKRIRAQYELFLKGYAIAADSIMRRRK